MWRNQAQRHPPVRSPVKGAPAYRASKRPQLGRVPSRSSVPKRAARRRPAVGSGKKSRLPLLFHVLVVSVAAQLAAVFAGSGALVAVFTLLGLLLSAVVIHSQ